MFISTEHKSRLLNKAYEVDDLKVRVAELEKSLQAIADFLNVYKIKIPQMQNVTSEVMKYEKKCKKCECCPSSPNAVSQPVYSQPAYGQPVYGCLPNPSLGPWSTVTVTATQCKCGCHSKKK